MTPENEANIKTLIRHYQDDMPGGVVDWSYEYCVFGVAKKLHLVPQWGDEAAQINVLLGITDQQATKIIRGPGIGEEWEGTTPEMRRDSVIGMLQGLLVGEMVNWRRPKI